MMDYAGGNDGNAGGETTADIPQNRTLMLEQFTSVAPLTPTVVHGLETIRQVFEHYRPEAEVGFTRLGGVPRKEVLRFTRIEDFEPAAISRQSKVLQELQSARDAHLTIITQLRANRELQAALADEDARKALQASINAMIAELKTNL